MKYCILCVRKKSMACLISTFLPFVLRFCNSNNTMLLSCGYKSVSSQTQTLFFKTLKPKMSKEDIISEHTKIEFGLLLWRETKDGCQFAEQSIHTPGICQWKEKEQTIPYQTLCPYTSTLHTNAPYASTSWHLSTHELVSAWKDILTTNPYLNLFSYLLNYPHSLLQLSLKYPHSVKLLIK